MIGEWKLWSVIALVLLSGVLLTAGEIGKILVVGNSIMKQPPAPQIGWNGNWGMAASSEGKDYVHLLYGKILPLLRQKNPPKLELTRLANEARMLGWDALAGNDADLIIVQVSDNYRGKVDQKEFGDNYAKLLAALRGKRNPLIVCLSNWSGGRTAELIKRAAGANGAVYADIGRLGAVEENKARSEKRFENGGVNWHPGDRGMAAIADTVFTAMEERLKEKINQ